MQGERIVRQGTTPFSLNEVDDDEFHLHQKIITMESEEQDLLQVHNDGGAMIKNGDFALAIKLLTSGIKQVGIRLKEIKMSTVRDQQNNAHQKVSNTSNDIINLDDWMDESKTCCSDCSPLDDGFVYDRPISVQEYPALLLQTCQDYNIALSIAMTFNLALAHHLLYISQRNGGPDSNDDKIDILQKAIRLYKLAMKLQKGELNCNATTFRMAIFNNLGNAYKLIKDDQTSHSYFQQLLILVCRVVTQGSWDPAIHQSFLTNISHLLVDQQTITAPAA